ncbi:hypothetical protein ABIE13_005397 [Ottowia thiooxydans]|uniref:Uncharacterized protein n=1 Tax=Ottowia thiooxydans TaxID=219182 RepID=A0ABV2QIA9_9BURK
MEGAGGKEENHRQLSMDAGLGCHQGLRWQFKVTESA